MAFLREPRHHCCHKVKAVGSGGGEGGERCVFLGKTMATAISKGTAVHSEAMGKGKGLGHLNASRALKAAVPRPAAPHAPPESPSHLCQGLLGGSHGAGTLSWAPACPAKQHEATPVCLACVTPPGTFLWAGLEGLPGVWDGWDHPPWGVGMELLVQSKFTWKKPQWKAQG